MEIIKKDGKYYRLQEVEEGFDIEREVGKLEEEATEKLAQAKALRKEQTRKEKE